MQLPRKNSNWILFGVIWGIFMFLVMGIATPYAEGLPLRPEKLLIKLIIWLAGGLAFGYIAQMIERRTSAVKDRN